MTKKNLLISIGAGLVAILLLNSCDSNESAAQDVVRSMLRDPDSAKFGEFLFNDKTGKGCIEVNSKNGFGAYNGTQVIMVEHRDDTWHAYDVGIIATSMCEGVLRD